MLRLIIWPIVLVGCGSLLSSGAALEVPQYKVGEIATNTVVTPVELTVRDPAATTLLQARERADIPPILRYAPTVADEVERAFRTHMASLRKEFLEDLEAAYSRRQIKMGVKPTPKWHDLTARFQNQHKGCPGLAHYFPYWALDKSDEQLLSNWVNRLRSAMNRPIRPNGLAAGDLGSAVRLVTLPSLETGVGLRYAERYGVLTPVDNIVSVSMVARDLAAKLPEQDPSVVDFLENLLKPNCRLDEELTRLARKRRLQSLILAHDYTAGDTVVREGQLIDDKAVAALNALRAGRRSAFGPVGTAREPKAPRDPFTVRGWLLGVVGGMAVLLAAIFLARRGAAGRSVNWSIALRSFAHPPASPPQEKGLLAAAAAAGMVGETERHWRLRALEAESKVEKATELARANLANALKDEVVERLAVQRYELIDYLQLVSEHIAALEERLGRVQGPLSERLRVYEQRIAELEDELAFKDEENRALIRAHIQSIRERIALEKAGQGPQSVALNARVGLG